MKIHVMIGDKSDNIPAIRKRMGEKTAEKELKNLDTLLATDPELRGRYEFNQNLIDFNYIPKNIEDEILKSLKEQTYHFNTMSLMKVFMKLGLAKFSEDIQAFKLKDGDVKTTLNSHFTTITKNQSVGTSLADFF
jgi:5'-3' exonuclease